MFDCYKYMNVYFFDRNKSFENDTKRVALLSIDDGDFYQEYKKYYKEAIQLIREAKDLEGVDQNNSYEKYQEAFNVFYELDLFIEKNRLKVSKAKRKKEIFSILKIFGWIISTIISGIVSSQFFPDIFNRIYNYF